MTPDASGNPRPERHGQRALWQALAWGALAVAVLDQLGFHLLDARLPRDLGLYFHYLPEVSRALSDGDVVLFGSWFQVQGGWWLQLQALLLALPLPVGLAFFLPWVLALAGLLLATGELSRRLGGGRAATAAVALAATLPIVVDSARQAWIHVPEAALLLAVVALVLRDPLLQRRRHVAGLALAGGLALLLRTSVLVWALTLLPLVAWQPLRQRQGRGRLAWVLGAWALSAIPAIRGLPDYLGPKWAARERYVAETPGLLEQLLSSFEVHAGLLVLLGLVLAAPAARRLAPGHRPVALWLLGTAGVAVALHAGFGSGLSDFLVFAPALAVLAGLGLARLRWGPALPLALLAWVSLLQWLPAGASSAVARALPGTSPRWSEPAILEVRRPYTAFGYEQVARLIDASCTSDAASSCLVATSGGLFAPRTEDPGRLQLFLLGEERVELADVDRGRPPQRNAAAFARYSCSDDPPRLAGGADDLLRRQDLQVAWQRQLDASCELRWYTPGGTFARPLVEAR